MKLGVYIVAPERISAAYFINSFPQAVCVYVYPPIVARQRLGKNVTAARFELLAASFSVRSVSYQKKVTLHRTSVYILISMFLDRREKILNRMVARIPRFVVLLISL
jgi:hypothetical protein